MHNKCLFSFTNFLFVLFTVIKFVLYRPHIGQSATLLSIYQHLHRSLKNPYQSTTTTYLFWSSPCLCLFSFIVYTLSHCKVLNCISGHYSLVCVSYECSVGQYLSPTQKCPQSISGWMLMLDGQSIKRAGVIYLAGATHLLPYLSNIHEVSSVSGFQHPVDIKMAGGNCPFH